ncbi:MAG: ribonucleoside triphosphate reductase [Patescibacteria group bacterium]|jgi:ribonucleoside-triphosphate reductase
MQSKISQILKRSGEIVDFDKNKIFEAITKAAQAADSYEEGLIREMTDQAIEEMNKKFHERSIPAVEEIQDIVEGILITNKQIKAAKAYILYRDQHARLREINELVNSSELMEKYIKQVDWRVKENSNMSYSLQGLNNHISSSVSSMYWLNKVYNAPIREAYKSGDIHIHDLQLLSAYCAGWELKDLLMGGFGGVTGKVESKAPKHLRTALGQVVNFFYTLQGEVAGAEAFANFDTYLAPFIRYDNLNYNEVKQALQEFLFNMNVPTRVGFQTPFTNITMDLVPSSKVGDESIIIGGKIMPDKYKDFQPEIDMFNIAFAEVMMEGDAKSRVFTFPIPTYNITSDFDWESPVAEKIFEMTGKYGIPYFSNFINSDMHPDDARSMCCRLRLDNRELKKRGGGLFSANPLTGSIGVVTINMPRIGYLSNNKEEFFARLGKVMDLAKESLEIKRKVLEDLTEGGLYPYAKHYLRNIKTRFGTYWQNHFSTIGIIGVNEALLNFKEIKNTIVSQEGHQFAKEVLDYMRERLMDYQNETNNLFNLEATPGEGTARSLARKDKDQYPGIIVANEENIKKDPSITPYYTNSSQLPVSFTNDIFEALDLQDELQIRYTGGTVLHGFIGEAMPSSKAVGKLVKKIAENYKLPYFTITPTFSICPKHGYLAGEHHYCPKCDEENGYIDPDKEIVKPEEVVAAEDNFQDRFRIAE